MDFKIANIILDRKESWIENLDIASCKDMLPGDVSIGLHTLDWKQAKKQSKRRCIPLIRNSRGPAAPKGFQGEDLIISIHLTTSQEEIAKYSLRSAKIFLIKLYEWYSIHMRNQNT